MLRRNLLLLLLLVFACKEEEEPQTCTQILPETVWTSLDQARLAQDIQAIDEYIANLSPPQIAIEDVSGLRYVITQQDPSSTETPCLESRIKVKYTGFLLSNGNLFDESTAGATFNLNGLIDGWKIAFLKFSKGTKATLYIPSGLAYGEVVNGGIPANSNIIFAVELIDF
jgi:FKBP-type peptidyl-prolyl cis-trans isomerase FkpA